MGTRAQRGHTRAQRMQPVGEDERTQVFVMRPELATLCCACTQDQ